MVQSLRLARIMNGTYRKLTEAAGCGAREATPPDDVIRVFLVGDVMTGRAVDQILANSCPPVLYESYIKSAKDYLDLAVKENGPLPPKDKRGVDYIWGDAIAILEQERPDVRIINLETAMTLSDTPWPMKGINYRCHPKNVDILQAAKIDCCVLSNNHVLDWGYPGLTETLDTLTNAHLHIVGAGHDITMARKPAILNVKRKGRVLVFGVGHNSSGTPRQWNAKSDQCGVNYIDLHSDKDIDRLREQVRETKTPGDVAILSIHWGGNWGYDIEAVHTTFAHRVVDECSIDVVHGHSSHHPKAIEVYNGKLIIYGAGDFLNDYEGIVRDDYSAFHHELSLMYFANIETATGNLRSLTMIPTQIKNLRVQRASEKDAQYLYTLMVRECGKFNHSVTRDGNRFTLQWTDKS